MDGRYTSGIAAHISDLTYKNLPSDVVERVKLLVLDAIGVAAFGATLPWSERLRAAVAATEPAGKARVWFSGQRFSAPTAAMINGMAIHGFEFDDIGPGGHHSSVTLSSALALADQSGPISGPISGQDLIAAIVAGIETAARVEECVGWIPHERFGFHHPGIMGTFGAAACAARLLDLTKNQTIHALGHAGQQAASLMFTHHGGMGKRLAAGHAARAGTFSAILAQHGFTNAENVFEAEYGGFCSAHTGAASPPAYDLEKIIHDFKGKYYTRDIRIKLWPARNPIHATIEAIRDLQTLHTFDAADIEQVRIWVGRKSYQSVGWTYVPSTITSAQLSLFYVAAVLLVDRDITVRQFTEEKIRDPVVLDMIKRIEILHDPALDSFGSVEGNPVEIQLANGTVHSAWGRARKDILRSDVTQKFLKVTSNHLAEDEQQRIIDSCAELELLADVSGLIPE